ncbi:MAG: cation diffusion facilitator family transporter [Vampirovibrionales bacterium]
MITNRKTQAAFVSICSNVVLVFLKLGVGVASQSASITSEALHSFTDLLASVIAYFSVRKASEPADFEHQYGHGKFEDLSGVIEGLLILLAAAYIIYDALEKLSQGRSTPLQPALGIGVMLFSVVVNIGVSQYLFKVGRETDSMALLADAEHLRTDIYTSVGVLVGLVAIHVTGLSFLDPLVALLVAGMIIQAGIKLCMASGKKLLDSSLPEEELERIHTTLEAFIPDVIVAYTALKTRKAGSDRFLELTILLPPALSIAEGHSRCDALEEALKQQFSNLWIMIHMEPYLQEEATHDKNQQTIA